MRIDIHVHTDRYSACGRSSPEEMVERAIAVELDALVFTEHNLFWPLDELALLQRRYPQILLLRGAEFTSAEGEDLLVYGAAAAELIAIRQDAERLTRRAHALGGAVVIAHPYRYHSDVPAWLDATPVDAVEIMSSNIYAHSSVKGRALAERLDRPTVASSDGHHVDSLGLYAIDLHRPIRDQAQLAQALRERAFSLYVNHERIAAQNDGLVAQGDAIRRLLALNYGNEQIRAALPEFVSYTVIDGVREGIEMLRPVNA
jgi:hypothetical protein